MVTESSHGRRDPSTIRTFFRNRQASRKTIDRISSAWWWFCVCLRADPYTRCRYREKSSPNAQLVPDVASTQRAASDRSSLMKSRYSTNCVAGGRTVQRRTVIIDRHERNVSRRYSQVALGIWNLSDACGHFLSEPHVWLRSRRNHGKNPAHCRSHRSIAGTRRQ